MRDLTLYRQEPKPPPSSWRESPISAAWGIQELPGLCLRNWKCDPQRTPWPPGWGLEGFEHLEGECEDQILSCLPRDQLDSWRAWKALKDQAFRTRREALQMITLVLHS